MVEVEILNRSGHGVARRVTILGDINTADQKACLTAALKQLLEEGAPLAGLNFDGVILAGQNLAGRDLSGTSFNHAKLEACCLDDAHLFGVHAMGASFARSSLRNTQFCGAILNMADFRKADLSFAKLSGASFADAQFEGVTFHNTIFDGTALANARFSRIDFATNSFHGCSFRDVEADSYSWGNKTPVHPPLFISGVEHPVRLYDDFLTISDSVILRDRLFESHDEISPSSELELVSKYRDLITFFMNARTEKRTLTPKNDPI